MSVIINELELGLNQPNKKLKIGQFNESEFFLLVKLGKEILYFYFDFFEIKMKKLTLKNEIKSIEQSNEYLLIEEPGKVTLFDFELNKVDTISLKRIQYEEMILVDDFLILFTGKEIKIVSLQKKTQQ